MNKSIAKFNINSYKDREAVVTGLANAGYPVKVVEKESGRSMESSQFWVFVYEKSIKEEG